MWESARLSLNGQDSLIQEANIILDVPREDSKTIPLADLFEEAVGKAKAAEQITSSLQNDEPVWFKEFRCKAICYFIETQRLLTVNSRWDYIRKTSIVATVLEYARDLKEHIGKALARYGQHSQSLDQSLPQRLFSMADDPLESIVLKERMNRLDRIRIQLKEIGLLDEAENHPFDLAQLDDLDQTQRKVMTIYVKDTEAKLGVLADVARRIALLLNNVNQKFKHKQIRISREKGLIVEGINGQELDIESLSSGEQHELILHYDLLFRAQPNTLVLIDEPELSLHIAWQERFLPDLLEIVKTAQIDVLLATHSPYIVGDRADLMVALEAERGGD